MTPEQKAKELVEQFYPICRSTDAETTQYEYAKQCAIICVDELLKLIPQKKDWSKITLLHMEAIGENPNDFELPDNDELIYWKSVRICLTNI